MLVGRIGDWVGGVSGESLSGAGVAPVVGACDTPGGGDGGDPLNCSAAATRRVVQSRSTSYNKVPYTLLHPQ
jgi:hypothetical protein